MNEPRKWWVAVILSLVQPGLGQIYNGQIQKAIIIYALSLLLIPVMIICVKAGFIRTLLVALVLLTSIYYIWVAVDAGRTSLKNSKEYFLKKCNKVVIYICIIIAAYAATNMISVLVKNNFIQTFKFRSGSMEPTLLVGDWIFVDRSQQARNPQRGDLIVFAFPEDESKDFIKRVVAIGGDTVEIRDKQLILNGKIVKEEYIKHGGEHILPSSISGRDNFGPITVPANSFFVLGDNRDNSFDSRFFGFVDRSKIKGKVKSIYLSWDSERNAIRWERIGKEL